MIPKLNPTLHLRPIGDALVRDPITRHPLPKEGAVVPKNSYWLRRVREGSAEFVPIAPNPAPVRAPKTKAKK